MAYKYYWLSSAQTLEWIPWSEKILSVFFSAVSTLAPFLVHRTQKKTHVNELITESVNQSLLKEKNKLELNGSLKNSFKDSMIQ